MVFTNKVLKKQVEKLNVWPFVETFGSYKMEKKAKTNTPMTLVLFGSSDSLYKTIDVQTDDPTWHGTTHLD